MARLGAIVPLILTLILVGIVAAIAFVVWSIAHDVGHQTRQKLERKNVSFSRDGMKVGVKEISREQQEDKTQSVLMKVWNNASWPAYQSRLGWGQESPAGTPSTEKRNP
ncbi:hypothetical protein B0A52_01096 [Exophiala mesophila]|uniref:Uncharacterized protein n=1 Tax=Exophiala mesophila TaxID=212818 RepID=A0A438NGG4_EXOME|nr:hypothetical protein B0A52_01096 [Exophiala mesophila]